jgi:hypothetical protein
VSIVGLNPFHRFGHRGGYHHRRHHRNPFGVSLGSAGVGGAKDLLSLGAVAGVTMVAARLVPSFFGLTNVWVRYGAMVITGLGAGWAIGKFYNRKYSGVAVASAAGLIVADLVQSYLVGALFAPVAAVAPPAVTQAIAGLSSGNPGPGAYRSSNAYALGAFPNLSGNLPTNPYGGRFVG